MKLSTSTIINGFLITGLLMTNPVFAESANSKDILIQSAQQFNQEQKVALVVGVSQYDRFSGLSRLNYAHRDAQIMQNSHIITFRIIPSAIRCQFKPCINRQFNLLNIIKGSI